jgi:hypothetical protein
MISTALLRRDQYRQSEEWEYGPHSEEMDWERHAEAMEQPNWLNYAVYADGKFCAAISYEAVSPRLLSVHVAKEPYTITPRQMADLLIEIADYFYQNGIEELQAIIPFDYRPSRRLALRTGMTYRGKVEQGERYAISKAEYYRLYNAETKS